MQRLLLFDIDGTMLISQGLGMQTMHRAGVEVFGEAFSFEGVVTAGGLDPLLFASAAEQSGLIVEEHHHVTFHETYLRLLPQAIAAEQGRLRVLPGIVELIDHLADDDRFVLGLLSGNYTRSARIKLEAGGIDMSRFAIHAFGDEAADRPALVPLAMQRYEAHTGKTIRPEHVILIGDTPKDVHAAKSNGARVLGVATGPFTVDELLDAGADAAMQDLTDLHAVLAFFTA